MPRSRTRLDREEAHQSANTLFGPALAIVGALLLAFAIPSTWLVAIGGDRSLRAPGTEIPVLPYLASVCVVVILASAVIEGIVQRKSHCEVAVACGALVIVLSGLWLLALETIASAIPTGFVPVTLRRFSGDLRPGTGAWLGLIAGVLAVLGGSGVVTRTWNRARHDLTARAIKYLLVAVGIAVLVVVVAPLARYRPWVDASASGEQVSVEGWKIPWVGPFTLVLLWIAIAAIVASVITGRATPALVTIWAGVGMAMVAGLVIVLAPVATPAFVVDRLPHDVRGADPSVTAAAGAYLSWLAGVMAAAVGTLLLATSFVRSRGEPQ